MENIILFVIINLVICNLQNISQVFYYIAGGIGLLFAGIGGFIAFLDWVSKAIEKNKVKVITKKLKQRYPVKDFKKTFELIKQEKRLPVYILDKKGKFIIWVDSPQRLYDLGFNFKDVRPTTKDEIDSYKEEKIFYK